MNALPKINLIYDPDCPNVEKARQHLRAALVKAGLAQEWREWNRGDQSSPDWVRAYGSPTILVNGQDAAGAAPSGVNCCRVYEDERGRLRGVPAIALILAALTNSNGKAG